MSRLLERQHSRQENRRRSSRLRSDLARAVRSSPGDVAGFAAVDKPRDMSLWVAYEDASHSRLAGLEEYVQNLCFLAGSMFLSLLASHSERFSVVPTAPRYHRRQKAVHSRP